MNNTKKLGKTLYCVNGRTFKTYSEACDYCYNYAILASIKTIKI